MRPPAAVDIRALPINHVADARARLARRTLAGQGELAAKIRANTRRARRHPLRAAFLPWSV